MAEYIEREALLKWAREFCPNDLQFASAVINAPIADVAEVRHGVWINDKRCYHCSCCGRLLYQYTSIGYMRALYKYCPSCGAKMDGSDEG